MKVWFLLFILLVGIGIGLGVPSVAPKYLGPYFPKGLATKHSGVHGTVVKKQLEDGRLLLTISAPDGAILATFEKQLTEISLLVDQGDSITLDVQVYAPFVKDPPILRVKKPDNGFSSRTELDGEDSASNSPASTPQLSPKEPVPSSDEPDLSETPSKTESKPDPFF
ncbi:MAG: hypothetical protein MRJ96_15605 [Nitrospirales bacterium]|nr:hypothetical protein [Nitrospira sp.]MDR4502869.1 hypothetical protein [Nitrospirales bacterium]